MIVEDEKNLARFVSLELQHEGYDVVTADNGREGLEMALEKDFDLILLDLMLPEMDGFEVTRRLQQEKDTYIMMMTARDSIMDIVAGLDRGADDYIVKPFEIMELLARIEVVLRRYHKLDRIINILGLEIDTDAMCVKKEGKEINLTKKEYDTLLLFARNPGNVLFREIIYERVWGGDYIAGSRTVDLHVQRVRKKVGWEDFLITVPKMGYRLEKPR